MNLKQRINEPGTKLCIECSQPIDANAVMIMTGKGTGVYLCAACRKEYEDRKL